MRFWPFTRRPSPPMYDASGFAMAELAPHLGGAMAVEQARAEGRVVAFGGRLLLPPASALSELLARFRPFGYTPFLQTAEGLTWVRALPFVDVDVPARPALNLSLFVLTVIATFLAGALPLGAAPVVGFNPLTDGLNVATGARVAATPLRSPPTRECGPYSSAPA